jgi:glycosyltransferase involved in cell wall biosynthesis
MPSIVIAAHNEAAVIRRGLDALLGDTAQGEFDVIVVANGCTDDTARIAASSPGVRVLDLPAPGKAAALNAGDDHALGYPRIYLDADIVLSAAEIRALCDALAVANGGPDGRLLAATARREIDVTHSPALVRAYYAINSRLPVFRNSLIGRGVIALSSEGRGRFSRFPDLVADDLFLDSLYMASEKREVDSVTVRVAAPRRTRDLLRRLARVRRANASMRASLPVQQNREVATSRSNLVSWLRDVVLPNPVLIPAAVCYVSITIAALIWARLPRRSGSSWERDESSRRSDLELSSARAIDG